MIKNKVNNLNLSATLKINEISKKLEREGKNIIKFGFGQSPFQVPEEVVEELKKKCPSKKLFTCSGLRRVERSYSKV